MPTPYVGELGAMGLIKEVTLGTFLAPNRFIPIHLPCNIGAPDIDLLLSKGVRAVPDMVYKAVQGASRMKAGKIKFEVEPDNVGEVLQAAFGQDTKTGAGPTYTHTFARQAVAQLPTYSLWLATGQNAAALTYPEFAGCMLNKLDFEIDANAMIMAEADWVGSKYVSGGVTQTTSYSTLNPFKFDQVTLTVGGAGATLYKKIKLTLDNKVKVDPVLGGLITSNVIYSEGFEVTLSATLVAENTTEWSNFLNGTSSSFVIVASGTFGGNTCSLTFNIPNVQYKAAPLPLPTGLVEIVFSTQGIFNTGTSYTANAVLVNDVSTQY